MDTLIEPPAPPATVGPRHRWTTEEFHRLVDSGFVREGSSAFLWDGKIIRPMAKKPPCLNAEESLRETLAGSFPSDSWTIYGDSPLHLRDGFDPQPDLLVLRGPRSDYRSRAATPADVVLLVEISSTTYAYDSGVYAREYAVAGIAPYWIVNLPARRIEVYSEPDAGVGAYRIREFYGLGTQVPLPGGPVSVEELLRDSLDVPGA